MFDLIRAIFRLHCGWCDVYDTWMERHYPDKSTKIGKMYWKFTNFCTKSLPIWKAGRWWHFQFHRKRNPR